MKGAGKSLLEVRIDEAVATYVLNRPEVRNALGAELMRALEEALESIQENDAVRVVVITGAGKAFSAGADLAAMQRLAQGDEAANRDDALRMGGLFHKVARFPKPVVARVNGPAIGGGVGLMAACDVVVCSEVAFFQFSEVRLGLVPAVISPFCIRRLGPAVANRLFLTAERIDAQTALRLGLVDRVAAAGALDDAVAEVCDDLLRAGPQAAAEAKKLVEQVSTLPPQDVLSYTAGCIARLRAGAEAEEGMRAFLEKRSPSWLPASLARGRRS